MDGVDSQEENEDKELVFVENLVSLHTYYHDMSTSMLEDLSTQRDDFLYFSLLPEYNKAGEDRDEKYSPKVYPATFFDGGYESYYWNPPSTDTYGDLIDSCLERRRADVELDLSLYYIPDEKYVVEVNFSNNEAVPYSGDIILYFVVRGSSYTSQAGYQLSNLAIDTIEIPIRQLRGSYYTVFSRNWVIDEIQELEGNSEEDLQPDNVMVLGAVYNSVSIPKVHQTEDPGVFLANYVDEASFASPVEAGDPPTIEIVSPLENEEVMGDVTVLVEADSENELQLVSIKLEQFTSGDWVEMEENGTYYTHIFDSSVFSNDILNIEVSAYDSLGISNSVSISVIVNNEDRTTPPKILSVDHEPFIPREGETITVTSKVEEVDTRIIHVGLLLYRDGMVSRTEDMEEIEKDLYRIEIGPFNEGQSIGFQVQVEDDHDHRVLSDQVSFLIRSPQDNTPDNTNGNQEVVEDPSPSNDSSSSYLALLPILMIISRWISGKRRKIHR